MYKNCFFLLIACLFPAVIAAQSLEQAKAMFANKEYGKAKPVFQRYLKGSPGNGSYNYWYGVCCYETGEKQEAEKYLLKGAERRVQDAYLYLGKLYFDEYRFDESAENYETYINLLKKGKKPYEAYQTQLSVAKLAARMLKGVEEVTFIDSIVVDKKDFLNAYKISEESGKIETYNHYFGTQGNHPGTVYQTQLGTKLYFGDKKGEYINLYSQNKQLNDWGKAALLPGIATDANSNYPYVLSDGITLYYASEGEGSIGGYDIFVTRYNSDNNSYLASENVGMPFNSPFNDYLYVIDEYNNLGWFASDRYQPQDKVCIYIFIPNPSKQVFNYESTDPVLLRKAAAIRSIKSTWKNKSELNAARQRLTMVTYAQPDVQVRRDFDFVVNDGTVYHTADDFRSPQAKALFKQWQQKEKDYQSLCQTLGKQRQAYREASKQKKSSLAPGIIDLEKRVEQMENDLQEQEVMIRNEENKFLSR